MVTSVVGGEVVKRVGFVLFGGQAVLPGGVQAGVPMSSATTTKSVLPRKLGCRERVPQDMGGRIVVKRGRIRVPGSASPAAGPARGRAAPGAGPGRGRAGRRRAGARPLRLLDSPPYAWPLLAASARACAAAIASAAAAADHGLAERARHLLDRLRGLAAKVNTARAAPEGTPADFRRRSRSSARWRRCGRFPPSRLPTASRRSPARTRPPRRPR